MKYFYPIIMALLILLAGYLITDNQKLASVNAYYMTQVCEMSQLNDLKEFFGSGISASEVVNECGLGGFICSIEGDVVRIKYPKGCPESGRQYCGFSAKFKAGKLNQVVSNYPCH